MELAVSDKQIETSPHCVAALLGEQRQSNKDVQIAISIRTRPQKATIGSMKGPSNEAARVSASRDRLLREGERRRQQRVVSFSPSRLYLTDHYRGLFK